MNETREIVVRLQLEYPSAPAGEPVVALGTDQPLLYRTSEAAKLLAVGDSLVRELIARGEIESVKIGTSRRITRAGIEAFVRRLAAEGGGPVGLAS